MHLLDVLLVNWTKAIKVNNVRNSRKDIKFDWNFAYYLLSAYVNMDLYFDVRENEK